MMKESRIDLDMLDVSLKQFIVNTLKITPIATIDDLPSTKVDEFYRILSGSHKNEIYVWDEEDASYKLIGADDREVLWSELKNVPSSFTPSTHNHTVSQISDMEAYIADKLNGFTPNPDGTPAPTHSHSNLSALNKVSYTGTSASVDLKSIEDLLVAILQKADKSELVGLVSAADLLAHIQNNSLHVTQQEKDLFASKSDFSGDYNDLRNKPASSSIVISSTRPSSGLWFEILT